MPALGGIAAPFEAHDLASSETELERDIVDLRIAGCDIPRHEPGVVRRWGEQIAGCEIAWPNSLIPRHPIRRYERIGTGQQRRFAHGYSVVCRMRGYDDRPLPTAVTGQRRFEVMGRGAAVFSCDADVGADTALLQFDQCTARQVGSIGKDSANLGQFGGRRNTHGFILPYSSGYCVQRAEML